MRIAKLQLSNFRSHQATALELERVNIIRGPNASGKSSIQMAVEYALTGRCQATDAAGRGAEILIGTGASELGVLLELVGGAKVSRVRNRAGGSLIVGDGKQSFAGKVAEGWVESRLGSLPVLSAALNAGRFLEMTEKEQKALLADALAAEPVKVPAEILRLTVAPVNLRVPISEVHSAAEVDLEYKCWYECRTQLNRDLKGLGSLTAPEAPADCPKLEDVRRKVSELQGQRDTLVSQRAHLHSDSDAKRREYEGAQEKRKAAEKELLSDADLERDRKAERDKAKAERLDSEIAELQLELTAKRQSIREWKEAPTICDKCGAPLKLTQAEIDEKVRFLEDAVKDLEAALEKKQADRTKIGDPKLATQRLEAHKRAMVEYAKAERILGAGLPQGPDTAKLDEDIAALDGRIAKGNETADRVSKLDGARQQYEKQLARQKQLQQQLEAVEKLVEYFGPKGDLKTRLVGGRLPAFRDGINAFLERFGFFCEFELEPFRLLVGNYPVPPQETADQTKRLALNQLSESEAYRFGIAFQVALAEATGVGFVVIDRGDMLQPTARRALTAALLESGLDQAILLSTGEPQSIFPEIPGTAFYELKNIGGVTRIEASVVNPIKET